MANLSLVINSQFKPFSYAEMLSPVQQATQAHQQLEEQYSALALQAAEAASEASATQDPIAYARYQKYSDDLSKAASMLAARGLQRGDRQTMMDLRTRYGEDIIPIQKAIAHRQEEAKLQQQALLQNPDLMFSRRAAGTSLDDYLMHPDIYQNIQMASGAHLRKAAAEMAKKIAIEVSQYGYDAPLDSFTNVIKTKYGLSSKDIQEFIDNPDSPNANKALSAIVKTVMDSSGMKGWADDNTLARGYDYAYQGLWDAIGPESREKIENWQARQDYSHAQKMNELYTEYALKSQLSGSGRGSTGGSNAGAIFDDNGNVRPLSPIEFSNLTPETQALYNELTGEKNSRGALPYEIGENMSLKQKWESLPNAGRRFINKDNTFNDETYKAAQEIVQSIRQDYKKHHNGKEPNSYSDMRTWFMGKLKTIEGNNVHLRNFKYYFPNTYKTVSSDTIVKRDGSGKKKLIVDLFGRGEITTGIEMVPIGFSGALNTDLHDGQLSRIRVQSDGFKSLLDDYKAFNDDVAMNRDLYVGRVGSDKAGSYAKVNTPVVKRDLANNSNFENYPNSTVTLYTRNKPAYSAGRDASTVVRTHYTFPVKDIEVATNTLNTYKGKADLYEAKYKSGSFTEGKSVDITIGNGKDDYKVISYTFGQGKKLVVNLAKNEDSKEMIQVIYPNSPISRAIEEMQADNNKYIQKMGQAEKEGDITIFNFYNYLYQNNNTKIQDALSTLQLNNTTQETKW